MVVPMERVGSGLDGEALLRSLGIYACAFILLASCTFLGIRWSGNFGANQGFVGKDVDGDPSGTVLGFWLTAEPEVQKVEQVGTVRLEWPKELPPVEVEIDWPPAPPTPTPTVAPVEVTIHDAPAVPAPAIEEDSKLSIGDEVGKVGEAARESGWWGLAWLLVLGPCGLVGIWLWRRRGSTTPCP